MEVKLKNIVNVGDIVEISGLGVGLVYCVNFPPSTNTYGFANKISQLATIWWFRPGAFADPGRKSTERIYENNVLAKCS